MRIGSLFSGIGGFDLAARWMGWETKWYSEIDPYACKVMERWFPEARNVGDITTWRPTATDSVDLICGGFPCQPVSLAGKGLAQDDERWLWPEFARVLGVLRPRYVVVENVPGLRSRGMDDVLRSLAQIGYDAWWTSLSAADVGAPHKRERVWIVAHPQGLRRGGKVESRPDVECDRLQPPLLREVVAYASRDEQGRVEQRSQRERVGASGESVADASRQRLDGTGDTGTRRWTDSGWWLTEPNVGQLVDGLPLGLAGIDRLRDGLRGGHVPIPRVARSIPNRVHKLKGLGNAIVPHCAYEIFKMIAAVPHQEEPSP